jgi:DNA polymerase-3 subunit delta
MPLITDAQARASLKKHTVAPVYLLVGDDEVGKEPLLELLSGLIEPDLQAFNLQRFYANERSLDEIVAAARTLPFLGTRRVIIALRSEAFLKPRGRAGAASDDDEGGGALESEAAPASAATAELERYLASPSPENVLVLVAADMARNTRIGKQLLKGATTIEYWGLKSDRAAKGREIEGVLRAAEGMIREALREAGLRIRPDAVEPLLEHAGTDISVLRNDLQRLILYCSGRAEATLEDVRAIAGGAVQLDEWALTSAIQTGDCREALRQLQLSLDAGHAYPMLLGQLGWFVRTKLAERSPARLGAAVDALFRADIALKSSGGDAQVLLERLVVELCGGGGADRRPAPGRWSQR